MHRRKFLGATAAAATGAGLAAPALAQDRITWDMVTSWPTGAPGLDDSARRIAQRITDLSGGRLVINVHGAGEIVPAFGVFIETENDVDLSDNCLNLEPGRAVTVQCSRDPGRVTVFSLTDLIARI